VTVRWLSVLLATFSCIALSIGAQAENEWMLWERQLDVKGQADGGWRRKQAFEAERWCKGAMTTANQPDADGEGKQARRRQEGDGRISVPSLHRGAGGAEELTVNCPGPVRSRRSVVYGSYASRL
jgi:hypothetical protein